MLNNNTNNKLTNVEEEENGDENNDDTTNNNKKLTINLTTAPKARLCHLIKWSLDQGYGFQLCSDDPSMFIIGSVDFDSPAEATGLKQNDQIIEINYKNVINKHHNELVALVKNGLEVDGRQMKNEVVLLVVDNETKDFYKDLNIEINSQMENMLKFVTPKQVKGI